LPLQPTNPNIITAIINNATFLIFHAPFLVFHLTENPQNSLNRCVSNAFSYYNRLSKKIIQKKAAFLLKTAFWG